MSDLSAIGSDEWIQAFGQAFDGVGLAEVDVSISHAVEKTPAGKVSWTERWKGGKLESVALGADKAADIAFTTKWSDFLTYVSGDRTPSVMFMQGRLKMTGDMRMLLAILPSMDRDGFVSGLARLGAATDR